MNSSQQFVKETQSDPESVNLEIKRYTNYNFSELDTSTTAFDGDDVYLEMCLDADPGHNLTLDVSFLVHFVTDLRPLEV